VESKDGELTCSSCEVEVSLAESDRLRSVDDGLES